MEKGTAEQFWDSMYGLGWGKRLGLGRGVYPVDGKICVYYIGGFHGQHLYGVRMTDVERLLPEVRRRAPAEGRLITDRERRLLLSNAGVHDLVRARTEAEGIESLERSEEAWKSWNEEQAVFSLRWGRIRRYWLNILFEGLLLNSLAIGIWLPFFLKGSHLWRALAAALALPVLCLPYFLGYCSWTFTSVGPSGGALYPWILLSLPLRASAWNSFDRHFVQAFSYPLEPLSQIPGPIMSVSGMGGISPSSTLIAGMAIGAVVYALSRSVAAMKPANPDPGSTDSPRKA